MHWPNPMDAPDVGMILGRLLERSETTVRRLDTIDERLRSGDRTMSELREDVASLKKEPRIGAAERLIKEGLRYLVPLGVLWATGSLDAAVKMAGVMK